MFLFDRDEQLICTLGNSTRPLLSDQYDDKINADYTYNFTVSGDIDHASDIKEGNYVLYQDRDGHYQMFEIIEIEEEREDRHLRTAYCEHAITELNDDTIRDKRPQDTTAELALSSALEDTRWEVGSVASLGINSTNFYDITAMQAVGKILNTWGGELRARVEIVGNEIVGRYIDIVDQLGADTGKRITYGKDVKSIQRTVDLSRVKTALRGRGRGEELETGGFGRRITFEDINNGIDYVEDTEARDRWGRVNPDGSKRHRFGFFEDSEEEDPAILKEKTTKALEQTRDPLLSYKIQFVDLEHFGLDHEKVRKGDIVRILDEDFRPPLAVEARVIGVEGSTVKKEEGRITLGNFLPMITDDNRLDKIEADFNRKSGVWNDIGEAKGNIPTNWLNGQIDILTNQLRATGEFQNVEPIEGVGILLENNDITALGYGAIYLGPNTLSIAGEKDPATNDWKWRSWGNGQGFSADVFTAGILRGGKVHFNLEEGTLRIGESNEDYTLLWDGTDLWLNGQINFTDAGKIVAYINGQQLVIPRADIEEGILGNHKFSKVNGGTAFQWAGDD